VREHHAMPKLRRRTTYLTRRHWTSADAQAALSALAASGLSLAQFAKREGLVADRLYRWRRRLGAASKVVAKSPAFIEVRPREPEPVEIALRSGRILRVSEAIEASALRRFVEVLEQPC
jgi:transposase-like protein